ncbi:uncharacterized protein I303_106301 [Kwoniella dejecticola CBS 10117]|uniref:alpha-L-rhamnosidase n=1 Tax=Kwoniella dejecticola CBS 10117 TaxID=1296121 RepID=A0A1A6A1W8_9TREE|nr:uncharacterized protein I303_06321 [Kwoniella dejecticola CBS 10117]OBR84034.1 hypothetical protein I303_06321 [Kwoniella dejecticola CBS 10117]
MTIITQPRIEKITFEHYADPLGIDTPSPRISWQFSNGVKDWEQSEYEMTLFKDHASPSEIFSVQSSESVLVPWPAAPLSSRQRVTVTVRARSKNGSWTERAESVVEAGLLDKQDWTSDFVTCSIDQPLDKSKRPFRLRQSFTVPSSLLSRARLYVTALGVYESYLNGVRIGENVLAPGWTSYKSRLSYQTYDVTHLVKEGTNVIGAWVGEGWYAGVLGYQGGQRNIFGDRIGLMAQLEIDGTPVQTQWEWSYGSITSSGIYAGETYDTNQEDLDFNKGDWTPSKTLPFPSCKLFASQSPPIRVVKAVKPVNIFSTPSGKTIIDFGQNLGGVIKVLNNPAKRENSEIVIRHAEVMENEELGTRPLRYAEATDRIVLGGRSIAGWSPKFTFHGFRYVEITGWSDVRLQDIEASVLQSSMDRVGDFECSHALINKLHENAVWSTMGNTIGIPSDCPQRDERLGWTGDVCVFSPTMSYLFDTSGFLSEWLQDLWQDQHKLDGVVPIFVPDTGTDVSTPEAIWGDASVIVPRDLYTAHGDLDILRRQFDSVQMWLDRGVKRDRLTGLWSREADQLGDWLAPKAPPETPNMGPTDNLLVADAWLVHSTKEAAKIAKKINRKPEAEKYEQQATVLADALYDEYVTRSGRLVSETQTALCLLLHLNIYPSPSKCRPNYQALFSERLATSVSKANWLIDTGFAGTPIVLPTLADNGHLSHAYRMLQATECPSWLSPVLLGATTIWERWDSMLADGTINPGEMTSFNHYALGSVATFMHEYIGGLRSLSPGWKEILIKPQPGGTVTSARTSHISPYGKVSVEWSIKDGSLEVSVDVPPNCTAQVELPGKSDIERVGSGQRNYTVPYALPDFPPPSYIPHFAPVRPDVWAA